MGYLDGLTGYLSGEKGQASSPGGRGARGLPGPGFNLTSDGNYDIQDKRLISFGEGTASNDATNKHQLEINIQQVRADFFMVDGSSHMTGDLDLRGNKPILPGEINMNQKLITNLDTD